MCALDTKEDAARDGSVSVVCLRTWKELRIPTEPRYLREVQGSASRDQGSADAMDQGRKEVTSLDQQIEQMEAMARQHYPNSDAERMAYMNRLLTERLREYHFRFVALPVKEMTR
jgi:hypothetical protein